MVRRIRLLCVIGLALLLFLTTFALVLDERRNNVLSYFGPWSFAALVTSMAFGPLVLFLLSAVARAWFDSRRIPSIRTTAAVQRPGTAPWARWQKELLCWALAVVIPVYAWAPYRLTNSYLASQSVPTVATVSVEGYYGCSRGCFFRGHVRREPLPYGKALLRLSYETTDGRAITAKLDEDAHDASCLPPETSVRILYLPENPEIFLMPDSAQLGCPLR